MQSYLFIALTKPVAGAEADYHLWYDEQHLHDVLDMPGFLSARRYRLVPPSGGSWQYLALYEFESDDPEATLGTLSERVASAAITISPALDRENMLALIAEPISETLRRG